jgi:response regulator RpfG family c-di-GMP phosphodiesterase
MTANAQPNLPILVVDDDHIVLLALSETLSHEGYTVATAQSAPQALEMAKKQEFAVIVSDQMMPEMTGLEFFNQIKQLQPHASRVLITGVLTLRTVIDAINQGEIYRFLAKPWVREELIATVKSAYQRHQLLEINQHLQKDSQGLNQRLMQMNTQLEEKIDELSSRERELNSAHQALTHNFNHSLELCYRIINTYHPMLGKETKAIVNLCEKMIETGLLNAKQSHALKVSAWLQNIGLLGISRQIITKARFEPDTLTETESELIRNHPVYGQAIASFVDELEDVGVTIRAHHERWDGTGYPDGLAMYAIPESARLLAVVVFFVESGLPKEEAIQALMAQSGSAFDPEAVRLFLKANQPMDLPRNMKEVLLSELQPGMMLARGIFSPGGLLLIPEESVLNERILKKITDHNMVDPINQRLLVYAN